RLVPRSALPPAGSVTVQWKVRGSPSGSVAVATGVTGTATRVLRSGPADTAGGELGGAPGSTISTVVSAPTPAPAAACTPRPSGRAGTARRSIPAMAAVCPAGTLIEIRWT